MLLDNACSVMRAVPVASHSVSWAVNLVLKAVYTRWNLAGCVWSRATMASTSLVMCATCATPAVPHAVTVRQTAPLAAWTPFCSLVPTGPDVALLIVGMATSKAELIKHAASAAVANRAQKRLSLWCPAQNLPTPSASSPQCVRCTLSLRAKRQLLPPIEFARYSQPHVTLASKKLCLLLSFPIVGVNLAFQAGQTTIVTPILRASSAVTALKRARRMQVNAMIAKSLQLIPTCCLQQRASHATRRLASTRTR